MDHRLIAALIRVMADREKWVRLSDPKYRSKIKKQEETIKDELESIAGDTETKESNGSTLYLLHRGMSANEFLTNFKEDIPKEYGVKVDSKNASKYRRNSSWSTDIQVAFGFAHGNAENPYPGVLVSAWVEEEAIIARLDKEHYHYSEKEKEVIVGKGVVTKDYTYQRGASWEEQNASMAIRQYEKILKKEPKNANVKKRVKYLKDFLKKHGKKR